MTERDLDKLAAFSSVLARAGSPAASDQPATTDASVSENDAVSGEDAESSCERDHAPGRMTMMARKPMRAAAVRAPRDSSPRMTMTRRDAS